MNVNNFIKTAFPKVISDWSKSGLEPIPAIIVAPQAASQWASNANTRDKNIESIKALINYANEVYNIDLRNVVLMGHSIGGNGVIHVAYEMNKKYSKDYFSKLVIFSATYDLKYPSNDVESGHNYFANKEIKGYSENTNCKPFFEWINKPDNFRLIKGVSHGDLPRAAMYLDENNDSVSDIVYWLFGKNEKCDLDGDDNYSPQGDNPAAGITASCIGDYENTIGHARLSVNVMSGNATKYTFINGGATVQTGSINTYYSSNSLEILIHPKVKITSSKGASTTISCMVNHSTYPSYNKKGYYFKVKSNKDKSDSIVSPYNKNRMPYYIHIPENVSPNEKLPLIVGLHGGFGIGTCTSINGNVSVISEGGQTNEYFKNVYWVGKHYNINGGKDNDLKAVILTVSNNRCSWKGDMYSVVEIMRAIIKTYNIDVDKVYVTGVSQGGMGSLYLDFLEESILYKVENGDTTISDIASRYNTTIDEIAKYNKKSDNEISYSNSSQGLLRKDSILLVRPRSQNDPRSIFALVMSFSPAHDSYRYGFVNPEGKTPPNTLKTPLWIITSNDEYTKVQDMAKEMTRYYSKAGDIRYTVLTQINKKPAPDDLYYDEHDTDTCFFNRTSAAKWMINQSYGKVTVSNNSEIDAIEREMGSHFKQVWRP